MHFLQMIILIGFTASCAAWTKNEGLVFFVLVILVRFIGQIAKNDWSNWFKEIFCFLLGMLPVMGTLLYFKLNFAPRNDMINIPTNAISFNLYYGGLSVSEMLAQMEEGDIPSEFQAVSEETPQFKDISMKNINCKGAHQAIYLQGLPEMNLENVVLENLTMESDKGLFCMDAQGITIKGLHLKSKESPSITFINAKEVHMEGLELSESMSTGIAVHGQSADITLNGTALQ